MTVLRSIEHKLESLFEGLFGRAFRTHVQPVELARKLQKEMDDHKVVSVSRVYVPNEYTVYLAPRRPRAVLRLRAGAARGAPAVPRRARAPRGLRAARHPLVSLETDDDLEVGRIRDRDPHGAARASAPPDGAGPGRGRPHDGLPRAAGGADRGRDPARAPPCRRRWSRSAGTASSAPVDKRRALIGRSQGVRRPAGRPERLAAPRGAAPARAPRSGSSTSTRPTASRSTGAG